jgi:hypothetical protein
MANRLDDEEVACWKCGEAINPYDDWVNVAMVADGPNVGATVYLCDDCDQELRDL